MAVRQHRETVVVPAARGTIVDRNGEALAIGRLDDDDLCEPASGRRRPRPHALGGQAPRRGSGRALSDADRPLARLRLRRPEGGSAQGREAREARVRRPRLLPGGAPLLPAGASRRADPRLRGSRQQGPRGARAIARGRPRRPAREPDDRQGSVRPRARRRRDEDGDAGQGRPAHDRPSDPGERRRDPRRDSSALVGEVGDRRRDGPADGRGSRDGDRAAVQREPVPDDACRTGAATGRSPTRTSPGRRSSS